MVFAALVSELGQLHCFQLLWEALSWVLSWVFAGVCLFLVSVLSREVNFCKRAASGLKVILASFGRVQRVGV